MNAELLRRIIKSYRSRDDQGFISAVQKLIESERRQGHVHLAKDLSNLLSNGHSHQLTRSTSGLANPPRSKAEETALFRTAGKREDPVCRGPGLRAGPSSVLCAI